MAPRRGGGSGGIDVGPVQNRCSFSDTIGTTTVVARLAIDGTALTFLLVIPWLWFAARRKNPNLKRLLPWHTFGILLVMDSMYISLDILDTVLANCFIIGLADYTRVNVAVSVLSEFSNLLALGIILIPLTLHILHRAGQKTRIVTIINGCVLGIVALMMVPFLIVNNMSNVGSVSFGPSFPVVADKLGATYYVLYFVASTVGSLILFFALLKAAGDIAITTPIKVWTIFTTSTLLLGNLAVIVETFGWAVPKKAFTKSAWITFVAFFQFFFVLTIWGILQTAISAAMPYIDPTSNATYDPHAPEELEPGMHKRFTYTGGSSGSQPSPQLYETQWASTSTRTHSNDAGQPISPHAL